MIIFTTMIQDHGLQPNGKNATSVDIDASGGDTTPKEREIAAALKKLITDFVLKMAEKSGHADIIEGEGPPASAAIDALKKRLGQR